MGPVPILQKIVEARNRSINTVEFDNVLNL
jgi:hypothetical protein